MARIKITAEELDRRLSTFEETFTGLDLRGMVVHRNVDDTKFDDCDLSNTNFSKASLSTVVFTNCDLRSISLRGATLNNVDFHKCNLFDGDFSRAGLRDVSTSECNLVGTRWKDARLENCELNDTNLSRAVFYTTTCTRSRFFTCDFSEAIFAGGEFADCDFLRAVMCRAKLRSRFRGSSFRDANFERASLNEADFFGADLRTVKEAVYDTTYVREAKFSEVSPDGWSVLRRKYTGPMFAFHVLLLVAFITPYILKTTFWLGVNRGQVVMDTATKTASAYISAKTGHPNVRQAMAGVHMTPCLSPKCRSYRVIELLVGADGRWWTVVLAIALLLYNLARALLTYRIALLRDAEERSGYTPALRLYQLPLTIHRYVMQPLIVIAILSFGYHLAIWLSKTVQLPA